MPKFGVFDYWREFSLKGTPAQIGGLVEHINNLVLTDKDKRFWLGLYGATRPFWVYEWPLPTDANPVVIRYPGDGEVAQQSRDSRFGWIDVVSCPEGRSSMVITYNFDPPNIILRLGLWAILFDALKARGFMEHADRPPRHDIVERKRRARELYQQGYSQQEIATMLNVSLTTAQRDLGLRPP